MELKVEKTTPGIPDYGYSLCLTVHKHVSTVEGWASLEEIPNAQPDVHSHGYLFLFIA